jgi:hypothetical protein
MRVVPLSVCFVLAGMTLATGAELSVPVTVTEPAGIARRSEPATGGIPFKKGQVRDASELALFTSAGQPVPAQFSKLSGYGDGSVQWALVDFPADVPAGGRAEYVVRPGKPAAPAKPLKITEAGDSVVVDTGAARFTVSRADCSLLASVELGGRKMAGPGSAEVVDAAGKTLKAGRPSRVTWEYRGPVRATLRLEGPYLDGGGKAFLFYTARLTFWSGSSLVRAVHSLRNSQEDGGTEAKIREARLSLGLGFSAAERGKGPTWTGLGDGQVGLLVAHRHGGGCFPGGGKNALHRLEATGKEVTVWAVPPAPGKGRLAGYGNDHFALADCAHKDTEVWLDFHAGSRDAAANEARRKALAGWLHALADPAWISETEAMGYGKFGTLADEIASYKKWGWSGWDDQKKHPRSPHRPDAYVSKIWVHEESESDSAECYLLMYLRTGERGYLDLGRAWAEQHKTHYAYRTDGFEYQGHTKRGRKGSKGLLVGWYSPKGDPYRWQDSRSEYCHFYCRGILDYYCLTGDVDALEGGRDLVEEVSSWTAGLKPGGPIGTYGCRGFGRTWLGALRLAQLTREAKDRALADRLGEVAVKAKDWDPRGFVTWGVGPRTIAGKWLRPDRWPPKLKKHAEAEGIALSKDGTVTTRDGKSWRISSTGGSWQQAIVQMALERYWRLSGDAEAKKWIVKMAECARDYQISKKTHQVDGRTILDFPEKDRPYHPAEWDDPKHKVGGHYTRFTVGVLIRAYSITGDASWLEWSRKTWNHSTQEGKGQVVKFAWHDAPKNDSSLATARLFYEAPRAK